MKRAFSNKKPGRPSALNQKLTLKIRQLYFSGKNIKEIQEELSLNPSTWDSWFYYNIQGFRDNFNKWRKEIFLHKAEETISSILELKAGIEDGVLNGDINYQILRIKFDAATFIAETLGKEWYSKRVIQEDPSVASKAEMDEMRQRLKRILSNTREKNHKVLRKMTKATTI